MSQGPKQTQPTLLALDTATAACSAAVTAGGRLLANRFEAMNRGQAERLLPMVAEVMAGAGLAFAALDGIAVTRGPGAFTGLRIGLAAARALGLAADSPVAAFTTLEVLAAAAGPGEQPLLVTIDSKRGDLFCQVFGPDGDARTEPRAIAPEDLAANLQGQGRSFRLAGDAMAVAAEALRSGGLCAICPEGGWLTLPDAAVLARLAAEHWPDALQDSHQGGDRFRPVPLYLRPPDAAVAADGGRLRPAAESLDGTPR